MSAKFIRRLTNQDRIHDCSTVHCYFICSFTQYCLKVVYCSDASTYSKRDEYLLCDLTLIPLGGGAAFPLFTFGLRTLLVNMTQLGFLLSTLRTGSVVRDQDVFAAQLRPKHRLRVKFTWEKA